MMNAFALEELKCRRKKSRVGTRSGPPQPKIIFFPKAVGHLLDTKGTIWGWQMWRGLRWTLGRRIGYAGGMRDLAYFEYKTVIPPQGSEREGTPAHYLVDVLIKHPVTGEKREGAELKKLANEHLTLVLNLGVVQLPELKPIS